MPKTYSLQGPILLEGLSDESALNFCAAVIAAIPAYSMGSANLNIRAQGPAGGADAPGDPAGSAGDPAGSAGDPAPGAVRSIRGDSLEALEASWQAHADAYRREPAAPATGEGSSADIHYDIRGSVRLVGLAMADGIAVVDAVLRAMPDDSLIVAGMLAQEEAPPPATPTSSPPA
jgi:hypothetical protein